MMTSVRATPPKKVSGPPATTHRIPTTRPPARSPPPILRLFPLPKYAVNAPVMTRKIANVSSRMGRNVQRSRAVNAMENPSELDARQRFRVDDAGDGPDLVHDVLTEEVKILRLDLRDQVVLAEKGVELHDLLHLEELVVHLVLLGGGGTDEDKTDGHL